jgi:hypothetical protein
VCKNYSFDHGKITAVPQIRQGIKIGDGIMEPSADQATVVEAYAVTTTEPIAGLVTVKATEIDGPCDCAYGKIFGRHRKSRCTYRKIKIVADNPVAFANVIKAAMDQDEVARATPAAIEDEKPAGPARKKPAGKGKGKAGQKGKNKKEDTAAAAVVEAEACTLEPPRPEEQSIVSFGGFDQRLGNPNDTATEADSTVLTAAGDQAVAQEADEEEGNEEAEEPVSDLDDDFESNTIISELTMQTKVPTGAARLLAHAMAGHMSPPSGLPLPPAMPVVPVLVAEAGQEDVPAAVEPPRVD